MVKDLGAFQAIQDLNETRNTDINFRSESENARVSSNKGRTNGKKRKTRVDPDPAEPAKRVQKEPLTMATGFLWNGDFVVDAKFACASCRRGHRAQGCKDALKGIPVQQVCSAGRPGKDVVKVDTKCDCGPVSCSCRHESYLLEERWVEINGVPQKKLVIDRRVYSNNRCERFEPDPVSMATNNAPYAMATYQGNGTNGASNI